MVDGDNPEILIDEEAVRATGTSRDALLRQIHQELHEIHRREQLYRGDRKRMPVRNKTVIVVDDGIATGSTIRVALQALRRAGTRRLILAVPVAPPRAIESLRTECDEIVCLSSPPWFRTVGELYEDFSQTTDEEVIGLLNKHQSPFLTSLS
jgi:predicted phosphoribosyltransferase